MDAGGASSKQYYVLSTLDNSGGSSRTRYRDMYLGASLQVGRPERGKVPKSMGSPPLISLRCAIILIPSSGGFTCYREPVHLETPLLSTAWHDSQRTILPISERPRPYRGIRSRCTYTLGRPLLRAKVTPSFLLAASSLHLPPPPHCYGPTVAGARASPCPLFDSGQHHRLSRFITTTTTTTTTTT